MRRRFSRFSRAPVMGSALAALLSSSGEALADDADGIGEDAAEVVVVRGRNAGGFVSRATIEDSPREITDAASLLEPLPGVHVRRLGADDSFATLSVRGTSSTQVAVYLAGVPLTGGADPTLDLATLPLWPGARARVFRSFAPAALGRGSLGGTLVLDTPSPRSGGDAGRTDVWAAIGSFGSRRLRIGDVREVDGVSISTGFSASRSDDDFTYLDETASLANKHDVFTTRANAGHADANALASIGLPVPTKSGMGALTVTTLAQIRKQELPGGATQPTPMQRLDSNRLLAAVELTLPAGKGAFGARGWGRREGLSIHDSVVEAQLTQGASSTADAILAAGGSAGWRGRPTEATTLDARVDASAERFLPGEWIGLPQPPGARRTNAGVGADTTWHVARPLTLAASARGDAWFDATDDASGNQSELKPTGNVGAELELGALTIASHVGALARPASFVERFGDHGIFLGNPTLQPESATTVDVGATFTKKLGALRVHLELATFATFADELIVFENRGAYGKLQATNVGRARLLGTESLAEMAAYGASLRLSHTGLATSNEGDCRFVSGHCERPPLPGRPEHDFVGDLAYTLGPVRMRYGIDVVTGISADIKGDIRVPDRVLHEIGLLFRVPWRTGFFLSFDVRNLFDLRVAEYPGFFGPAHAPIGDALDYPIPGRRILFGARWVFPEPRAGASFRPPQ